MDDVASESFADFCRCVLIDRLVMVAVLLVTQIQVIQDAPAQLQGLPELLEIDRKERILCVNSTGDLQALLQVGLEMDDDILIVLLFVLLLLHTEYA